jgi:hypothetical protein
MKPLNRILTEIALTHLNIPTLRTRRSDRLDFHDVSVWAVRSALKAAYDAGSTNAPAVSRLLSACQMVVDRWQNGHLAEAARDCNTAIASLGNPVTATANARSDLAMPFDAYEIHGIFEIADDDGRRFCERVGDEEAQFWRLYGHAADCHWLCLGNFKSREFAEEVFSRITGEPYSG